MLGITATNQAAPSNNIGYCGYGTLDSCGIGFGSSADMMLDDDMMDPLFDDDWLHEHNLDILFDLFEEEIENKCAVDSSNGSSTLFGTSPVASHLFGTSPSMSFDLLYFDNQQQPSNQQQQQNCNLNSSNSLDSTNNQHQSMNLMINKSSAFGAVPTGLNTGSSSSNHPSNLKSISTKTTTGNTAAPTMRIKRGLKKGQSEGVSLLARPNTSANSNKINLTTSIDVPTTSSSSVSVSGHRSNGNICKSGSSGSGNTSGSNNIAKTLRFSTINASTNCGNKIIVNRSNSDKTSAKITNFKNSILGKNDINKVTNGVEINYSKQSQNYRYLKHNCQQHVHYITGRAVIREHAYAVRGH